MRTDCDVVLHARTELLNWHLQNLFERRVQTDCPFEDRPSQLLVVDVCVSTKDPLGRTVNSTAFNDTRSTTVDPNQRVGRHRRLPADNASSNTPLCHWSPSVIDTYLQAADEVDNSQSEKTRTRLDGGMQVEGGIKLNVLLSLWMPQITNVCVAQATPATGGKRFAYGQRGTRRKFNGK